MWGLAAAVAWIRRFNFFCRALQLVVAVTCKNPRESAETVKINVEETAVAYYVVEPVERIPS